VERLHIHVSAGRPLRPGNVPQPGRGQVDAALTVRERANHPGATADLLHDPFQRVVGPDLGPVDIREGVVGQRLTDVLRDQLRRPGQLLTAQLRFDSIGLLRKRPVWAA